MSSTLDANVSEVTPDLSKIGAFPYFLVIVFIFSPHLLCYLFLFIDSRGIF